MKNIFFSHSYKPALAIAADTGPWLMPVQYERIARPKERPEKL